LIYILLIYPFVNREAAKPRTLGDNSYIQKSIRCTTRCPRQAFVFAPLHFLAFDDRFVAHTLNPKVFRSGDADEDNGDVVAGQRTRGNLPTEMDTRRQGFALQKQPKHQPLR
jgi:hypothetical protein